MGALTTAQGNEAPGAASVLQAGHQLGIVLTQFELISIMKSI